MKHTYEVDTVLHTRDLEDSVQHGQHRHSSEPLRSSGRVSRDVEHSCSVALSLCCITEPYRQRSPHSCRHLNRCVTFTAARGAKWLQHSVRLESIFPLTISHACDRLRCLRLMRACSVDLPDGERETTLSRPCALARGSAFWLLVRDRVAVEILRGQFESYC